MAVQVGRVHQARDQDSIASRVLQDSNQHYSPRRHTVSQLGARVVVLGPCRVLCDRRLQVAENRPLHREPPVLPATLPCARHQLDELQLAPTPEARFAQAMQSVHTPEPQGAVASGGDEETSEFWSSLWAFNRVSDAG